MQILAIHLRSMQLVAHNAHNLVQGPTFFADHKHLGSLYETYTEIYDAVVEKCIGLGLPIDLQEVTQAAAMKASAVKLSDLSKPEKSFSLILSMEKDLSALVAYFNEDANYGTKNFLQGIADLSDDRCYKLQQRLK